jgi:hypothetical protein
LGDERGTDKITIDRVTLNSSPGFNLKHNVLIGVPPVYLLLYFDGSVIAEKHRTMNLVCCSFARFNDPTLFDEPTP